MKKTIAIDIDDVLADSTDALRLTVNNKLGIQLEPHHYKVNGPYWQYYEHVWENNGLNDKIKHTELEADMINDQSHVVPVVGSIDALRKLSKNYNIVLVTARNPLWNKATRVWLDSHFKGSFIDLHVLGNHKIVESPRSKGEVCAEVGASWLVDDNPQHCLSAVDYGVDAILFGEYGWHFDAPDHLSRCKDWPAVLEYFDGQQR